MVSLSIAWCGKSLVLAALTAGLVAGPPRRMVANAFSLEATRARTHNHLVGPWTYFHSYPSSTFRPQSITTRPVRRRTQYFAAPDPNSGEETSVINNGVQNNGELVSALWIFAAVPLISIGLPLLLQAKMIGTLVIAKRVYIYVLAVSVVLIASYRGSSDDPALGSRLIALTREILPQWNTLTSMDLPPSYENSDTLSTDKQKSKQEDARFETLGVLDEVDSSAQAVSLPLLVGSSLAVSLLFVLLQKADLSSPLSSEEGGGEFVQALLQSFQSLLPNLTTWSNGLVLALFARAELVRLPVPELVATLGAILLSLAAFLGPSAYVWPLHNVICICLAVAVARVIQLPRLGPILIAVSLLVAYDVVSVGLQLIDLGSQAVAASSSSTVATSVDASATSDAARSAMGAVALSKAVGGSWQPGLLEVRLRGMVTDLLGLGDTVFPTLLSTFCLRYDQQQNTNYFAWSILGFVVGCGLCEGVPGISTAGLPALLFLVPSMMAFVGVPLVLQGNLPSFWAFDASARKLSSGEQGSSSGDT